MKLFLLVVTEKSGGDSVWTIFDEDANAATDRFLQVRSDSSMVSLHVIEYAKDIWAKFGRKEPDTRIIHHSGLWTSKHWVAPTTSSLPPEHATMQ